MSFLSRSTVDRDFGWIVQSDQQQYQIFFFFIVLNPERLACAVVRTFLFAERVLQQYLLHSLLAFLEIIKF